MSSDMRQLFFLNEFFCEVANEFYTSKAQKSRSFAKKLYEVGGGNYEVKSGEIRRASYRQVKFSRY